MDLSFCFRSARFRRRRAEPDSRDAWPRIVRVGEGLPLMSPADELDFA